MSASPKPPGGLQAAGTSLWRAVLADLAKGWELDAADLSNLEAACVAVDRATALERLVEDEGLTIEGSTGRTRLHPGIAEARLQRTAAAVALARVELAPPDVRTGALSGRQRADLRRMVSRGPA